MVERQKMTKAISEENKVRISDLVKQREDLEERLEMLSYSKNNSDMDGALKPLLNAKYVIKL